MPSGPVVFVLVWDSKCQSVGRSAERVVHRWIAASFQFHVLTWRGNYIWEQLINIHQTEWLQRTWKDLQISSLLSSQSIRRIPTTARQHETSLEAEITCAFFLASIACPGWWSMKFRGVGRRIVFPVPKTDRVSVKFRIQGRCQANMFTDSDIPMLIECESAASFVWVKSSLASSEERCEVVESTVQSWDISSNHWEPGRRIEDIYSVHLQYGLLSSISWDDTDLGHLSIESDRSIAWKTWRLIRTDVARGVKQEPISSVSCALQLHFLPSH